MADGHHKMDLGTRMERALFGDNSIEGTVRVIILAVLFALIFGSIFYFLR